MRLEASPEPGNQDRRVRRSRSALMAAAVRLVSERDTTDLPVTDLAEAADVSRRLVYLQFGDRDTLLVQAAVDLVRRELLPQVDDDTDAFAGVLALARHFAGHRAFYRAMLTGQCAFALTRTLNDLFSTANQAAVRELFGELDSQTAQDLAAFVAAGTGGVIHDWLIDGADPLNPEKLAARLLRLGSAVTGGRPNRADGEHTT